MNLQIQADFPTMLNVLIDGQEYEYIIDDAFKPDIERHRNHGRHGHAVRDLNNLRFECYRVVDGDRLKVK